MSQTTLKIGNLDCQLEGYNLPGQRSISAEDIWSYLPWDLRHCLNMMPTWWCRKHPSYSSISSRGPDRYLEFYTIKSADPFALMMARLSLSHYNTQVTYDATTEPVQIRTNTQLLA